MHRRHFVQQLGALGVAAPLASAYGQAPAYPARPITLVIPYSPGGPTDAVARALADTLRSRLGQPVLVENKPGAGTAIANEFVARASPDGYTLLLAGSSLTMAAAMKKVNYNPVRDYAPVSMVLSLEMFLAVRSDVPARNLAELISWLKANPGKASYGSVGSGSVTHLQMELFKSLTGTDVVHIPYKGTAPAMTDLIGGRIQMMFDSITTSGPYLKTGALRALAITLPKRSPSLPDIPTFAEAGLPAFDAVAWTGILAPAGTPADVVARLNRELTAALNDPTVLTRLNTMGGIPTASSPAEFAAKLKSETEKWTALVKERHLSSE